MRRTNKGFYKKRRNFNTFTKYKSNIPSSISSGYTKSTLEVDGIIQTVSGSANLIWLAPNQFYYNFGALLIASSGMNGFVNLFERMRINGVSINVSRIYSLGLTPYSNDYQPSCFISPYTMDTSINHNAGVVGADSCFKIEPNVTTHQTKYWSFPHDTSTGPVGAGLGIWFNTSNASSVPGEFDIYNLAPNNASATVPFYQVHFKFYCEFCEVK